MSGLDAPARLSVEAECRRINETIGYCLDHRLYDELLECFDRDAKVLRDGVELSGRDAIRAALAGRPADVRTRHCPTNYRFTDVASASARAVIYNLTYLGAGDRADAPSVLLTAHPMFVEYHDVYRRVGQRWYLLERRMSTMFEPRRDG